MYSPAYKPVTNIKVFTESGHTCGNATKCKNPVSSCIPSLFERCSPLHIIGAITFGILNPFNAFANRTITHVLQKINKVFPSFTNCNSPCSVVLPSFRLVIGAPLYHCSPRSVGSGRLLDAACCDTGMPVSRQLLAHQRIVITTARRCITRSESHIGSRQHGSAIAATQTPRLARSTRQSSYRKLLNDLKLSKPLSGDTYSSRHNGMSLCLAAGVGYRPNARCDSFMPNPAQDVNGIFA